MADREPETAEYHLRSLLGMSEQLDHWPLPDGSCNACGDPWTDEPGRGCSVARAESFLGEVRYPFLAVP